MYKSCEINSTALHGREKITVVQCVGRAILSQTILVMLISEIYSQSKLMKTPTRSACLACAGAKRNKFAKQESPVTRYWKTISIFEFSNVWKII